MVKRKKESFCYTNFWRFMRKNFSGSTVCPRRVVAKRSSGKYQKYRTTLGDFFFAARVPAAHERPPQNDDFEESP